jgi:hypothetical protein
VKRPPRIASEAVARMPDPIEAVEDLLDTVSQPGFSLKEACGPCHAWDAGRKARALAKGDHAKIAALGKPPSPPGAIRPTVNCWGCHYAYLAASQLASLEDKIERAERLRESWAENFGEVWRSRNRRRAWQVIQLLRSLDRRLAELYLELEAIEQQQARRDLPE